MTPFEDRLTVLVAEDDKNDVVLLRRALRTLEGTHRIIWVPDGAHVLAYFSRNGQYADQEEYPPPNLLILDNRMPRASGLEVLRWLRRQPRFDRLPVVIMSLLSPVEEGTVARLNAACCIKTADFTEMNRALNDAVVCAFRLASQVPDGTSYRGRSFTFDRQN